MKVILFAVATEALLLLHDFSLLQN